MNTKNRSNLLVGYFALDGYFTSIVGIGLNRWWPEKNGVPGF
jgi:hypothetical protein